MINIARNLSRDMPFIRVDLYEIKKQVYFSELTLFPCCGFMKFIPDKYDYILGSLIKLPQKVKNKS